MGFWSRSAPSDDSSSVDLSRFHYSGVGKNECGFECFITVKYHPEWRRFQLVVKEDAFVAELWDVDIDPDGKLAHKLWRFAMYEYKARGDYDRVINEVQELTESIEKREAYLKAQMKKQLGDEIKTWLQVRGMS